MHRKIGQTPVDEDLNNVTLSVFKRNDKFAGFSFLHRKPPGFEC